MNFFNLFKNKPVENELDAQTTMTKRDRIIDLVKDLPTNEAVDMLAECQGYLQLEFTKKNKMPFMLGHQLRASIVDEYVYLMGFYILGGNSIKMMDNVLSEIESIIIKRNNAANNEHIKTTNNQMAILSSLHSIETQIRSGYKGRENYNRQCKEQNND